MLRTKRSWKWYGCPAGADRLILAIGTAGYYRYQCISQHSEGVRMGYRLRGQEQVVRAVEDVKRAAAFGCRSFLVYDEAACGFLMK